MVVTRLRDCYDIYAHGWQELDKEGKAVGSCIMAADTNSIPSEQRARHRAPGILGNCFSREVAAPRTYVVEAKPTVPPATAPYHGDNTGT